MELPDDKRERRKPNPEAVRPRKLPSLLEFEDKKGNVDTGDVEFQEEELVSKPDEAMATVEDARGISIGVVLRFTTGMGSEGLCVLGSEGKSVDARGSTDDSEPKRGVTSACCEREGEMGVSGVKEPLIFCAKE